MSKIFKKTERNWKCSYCGYLNDLSTNTCLKCGSLRSGEEEEKEITTDFERTITTEIPDKDSQHPIISTKGGLAITIGVAILLIVLFVIVPFFYGVTHKTATSENTIETCKVISKEWHYQVRVFEIVEKTGIKSYTEPPKEATNVTVRQVKQDNGWYLTEYTYDYSDWDVVRVETIKGDKDLPTFKEYTPENENQKIELSDPVFSVQVQISSDNTTLNMEVSQEKWASIVPGQTYPLDDF